MRRGLLWLAVVDLKRAWLRSLLAALAIALALVAVTFFAGQVGLRQAELLTGYEESGAATSIVELSKVPTSSIADLVWALVCTENLNPNVLTMKSAQYGARIYDAGSLNLASSMTDAFSRRCNSPHSFSE